MKLLSFRYTEDTSTIILIKLSDSINYGEFVSIVDMCYADEHKRFASWDNNFVIFGEWPEEKKEISNLLPILGSDIINIEQRVIKPNFIELLRKKIDKFYTPKGLYLLLGWIALLISFFYFRRKKFSIAETPN